VNKDSSKDRSSYPYSAGRYLLHGSNTPQRCLKRSATALGERLSLGSALVDGGLCLRKPPNVRPVSVHDVGFVAAFECTSPPWPWRFTFVAPTMGARLLSPRASLLPLAAARSSARWWRIPSIVSPRSSGCSGRVEPGAAMLWWRQWHRARRHHGSGLPRLVPALPLACAGPISMKESLRVLEAGVTQRANHVPVEDREGRNVSRRDLELCVVERPRYRDVSLRRNAL
jgi:hypothetical protein